jgi:hypothetical protein
VFKVTVAKVTKIGDDELGIVTAIDRLPLPSDFVISPKSSQDHRFYQDGQAFVSNGYRVLN